MNDNGTEQKLAQILSTIFERPITPQSNISKETEEDWSSLKHIELIVMLEEEFEISFKSEDIPELNSQEKIVSKITELLN